MRVWDDGKNRLERDHKSERSRTAHLRVGNVGVSEHERRVVKDGINPRELDANLDDDSNEELLAQVARPEQIADRHVVASLAAALTHLGTERREVPRGRLLQKKQKGGEKSDKCVWVREREGGGGENGSVAYGKEWVCE